MAAAISASSSPSPSPRSADTGSTSRSPASVRASSRRAARLRPVHEVDLVERHERRQVGAGDGAHHVAVAGPEGLVGVEEHERRVHLGQGVVHGRLHAARERVEGLLEARQVEQHDLAALQVHDAGDAAARRLRVVADDAHLAPHERVHQRGLADVGAAEHGHEPRAELARSLRLLVLVPSGSSDAAPDSASAPPRRATPLRRRRTAPSAGRSGAPRGRLRRCAPPRPGRRTPPAPAGTCRRAGSRRRSRRRRRRCAAGAPRPSPRRPAPRAPRTARPGTPRSPRSRRGARGRTRPRAPRPRRSPSTARRPAPSPAPPRRTGRSSSAPGLLGPPARRLDPRRGPGVERSSAGGPLTAGTRSGRGRASRRCRARRPAPPRAACGYRPARGSARRARPGTA